MLQNCCVMHRVFRMDVLVILHKRKRNGMNGMWGLRGVGYSQYQDWFGLMVGVRARWFANRTYKATKGLPVFYVQAFAFRDLESRQSVNIFSLWPTDFLSAEGLGSILRKITSELHFLPPKKPEMKNLLQRRMYFLHIIWCSKLLLISGLFMR